MAMSHFMSYKYMSYFCPYENPCSFQWAGMFEVINKETWMHTYRTLKGFMLLLW